MAQFFFRALPVISARDATMDFEQLTFALNNGDLEVNSKGELKISSPTVHAVAVRETGKELEVSATKNATVTGFVWFKAEAGTVHFKVNKLEVALASNNPANLEMIMPFSFVVPKEQKWEGTLEGKIKEVQAAYTF